MSTSPRQPKSTDDRAAYAALLELVARLFLAELDRAALEELSRSDVLELLDQLEPDTAKFVRATATSADATEQLASEFCRLFLLTPGTTNPVASSFEPSAGDVLAAHVPHWEQGLGIEPGDGPWGHLPPDHLARLMALRAIATLDNSGEILADIERHAPARWLAQFGAAVLATTTAPIYRAAARLLIELATAPDDEARNG